MFLFWYRLPWITCYNRYCLHRGRFMAYPLLSINRQPSLRFGIQYIVLTLCRRSLIIFICKYILLRFLIITNILLIKVLLLKIIINNSIIYYNIQIRLFLHYVKKNILVVEELITKKLLKYIYIYEDFTNLITIKIKLYHFRLTLLLVLKPALLGLIVRLGCNDFYVYLFNEDILICFINAYNEFINPDGQINMDPSDYDRGRMSISNIINTEPGGGSNMPPQGNPNPHIPMDPDPNRHERREERGNYVSPYPLLCNTTHKEIGSDGICPTHRTAPCNGDVTNTGATQQIYTDPHNVYPNTREKVIFENSRYHPYLLPRPGDPQIAQMRVNSLALSRQVHLTGLNIGELNLSTSMKQYLRYRILNSRMRNTAEVIDVFTNKNIDNYPITYEVLKILRSEHIPATFK